VEGIGVEGLLLVAAITNLILLIWFITSINTIKSRLYDVYDQVFDLRESAQKIEKLITSTSIITVTASPASTPASTR
jgi:hypothetical protein